MVKNKKLSKAIQDMGWGELTRQIKYKSDWRGETRIPVALAQGVCQRFGKR